MSKVHWACAIFDTAASVLAWASTILVLIWSIVIAGIAAAVLLVALLTGAIGAAVLGAPAGVIWWLATYPPLGTAQQLASLRRSVRAALTAQTLDAARACLHRALGTLAADESMIERDTVGGIE